MSFFIALQANMAARLTKAGIGLAHKVLPKLEPFVTDPKAMKDGISALDKAHALGAKAAGLIDGATGKIKTVTVASAGGPKPPKAQSNIMQA